MNTQARISGHPALPGGFPSLDWEPVFGVHEAAEFGASVRAVSDALSGPEHAPSRTPFGLSGGNAGLSIFYDYVHAAFADPMDAARRDERWNAAVDRLASVPDVASDLYGGYSGVGWAAAQLAKSSGSQAVEISSDRDVIYQDLEDALIEELGSLPNPIHYDLVRGYVGSGLFALERWPHPRARRVLELVVDLLEARAEEDRAGVRWPTPPSLLSDLQRSAHPNGYCNLGVAHGIPVVWYFLSHLVAWSVRADVSRRLLERSIAWVLAQKLTGSGPLVFPSVASDRKDPSPALLAWCYGDLGLSAVLLVAGRCTGNDEWEKEAVSLARNATRVSIEDSRVRDTGLCHGAAGFGHVYNRLFQSTKDELFRDAARMWLKHALAMRLPRGGIAGYAAWISDSGQADGVFRWMPRPGLLDGAAGTALALLAGSHPLEPAWDRFLCLSPVPG
jgi:hypothetical protein